MTFHSCPWKTGKKPEGKAKQIVVCGTRTFNDYDLLEEKLDIYTFFFDLVEVHIGGLPEDGHKVWEHPNWVYVGADALANRWCEKRWWTKHIHHADWSLGKKAGPIRNTEMARAVAPNGLCCAFWDGRSRGTEDMINKFLTYNREKNLRVVRYKERK